MIRKLLIVSGLMVLLIGVTAFNAGASMFQGNISFAGNCILDNTNLSLATRFTSFNNVVVTAVDGAYSGITTGASGPPVTYTPFVFSPLPGLPLTLWTFNSGGKTYSFDATTMSVAFSNKGNLVVEGSGLAKITGFDNSPGDWSITANSSGTTFSFSGGSSAAVPIPAAVWLLGSGLIGLAVIRRKRKI
jgi:hypothetical protein